ncbi:TonB-dependent siderophore receptor [Limnohabitans sp. 2KL-1]|uniref:TonB-dependent receptor plug domain-containing protein n=1 Tax=Limnohabitans sp. 2KL-1 TaxID=1100699 RepID=UPI0013049356|nr:TonB-dependent receptor [Limnohabitans sp. 2KL-1]
MSLLSLATSAVLAQTTAGEIVVTASRTEQILTDVLPHTTVLGRDAIEQSQVLDLPTLLAREAGFQFTQSGGRGGQATAFLRGAASLQVLVLVDGVPVTKQDTTGAVSLEHIMLDQVDRIEIVRGNVSAIHGSGAVGGVIQVFTRQGQGQPTVYASAERGSQGSQRWSAGTSGAAGPLAYAVSVGRMRTDGINAANLSQTLNANPDADAYRNDNHALDLSYKFSPEHKLGLRSTHFNGRFDYDVPGSFSAPTDVHQGRTQLDSHTLYWSGRLGPQWSTRLNYSDAKERNDTDTVGSYSFTTQAQTRTRRTSWTHQFDLPSMVLSAGLDHQTQGIDMATDGVSGLSRERKANAVYGGVVYKRAAHNLQFNLRRDDVDGMSAKDSVYLGYGYDLDAQWKLIASHATAFNMPPLGYLFDPYSGNPDLRPETASTREAGVQWAQGPHRLRSTWFSSLTKDLLLYDMGTWQFSNVSRVKNQGLETSYSGRFHMTDLRASLSLQDPVNEATGQQLVRRAKTLASVSVSQALGLLTLGGSARYTRARPDIEGKPGLPSNTLLDLTARYSLSREWTLYGRVENATDSRYQTAYGYNQLPRTTTLGLSWKMKH